MTLFRDCAFCRRLKEGSCRGTSDWWPIRELWLCRIQTYFLIGNMGAYPSNPYTSGYTEAPLTSHRIAAQAPFETEATVWAELEYRLERTGVEGKWLVRDVQNGVELNQLSPEPRLALHFISGWYRKQMRFSTWQWERKHRRKHDKPSRETPLLTNSIR